MKPPKRSNVTSIIEKINQRRYVESIINDLYHKKIYHGISQTMNKDLGIIYCGKVFTCQDIEGANKQSKFEPNYDIFLQEMEGGRLVDKPIIERIDVLDIDTADLHVMVRCPYIKI